MDKLYLNQATRRQHGIGDELLGIVVGTTFRHAACYPSIETLVAALDDEDSNIPLLKSDGWRHEVGLCVECGHMPDEP